jgi:REP element-mobilizing transposase RayT
MAHSWQHQRRSIRLAGYDYAGDGAYFVTICAYQRACLFGTVVDGEMRLNAAGAAVERCWEGITAHFPQVILDSYVVMPNHVHGIVIIDNSVLEGWQGRARRAVPLQHNSALGDPRLERETGVGTANIPNIDEHSVGARHAVPGNGSTTHDRNADDDRLRQFGVPVAGDLATIIRSFKSAATKAVNAIRGTEGPGVWQRNYYEAIIRNEKMLNGIRQYILANPAHWAQDDLYER